MTYLNVSFNISFINATYTPLTGSGKREVDNNLNTELNIMRNYHISPDHYPATSHAIKELLEISIDSYDDADEEQQLEICAGYFKDRDAQTELINDDVINCLLTMLELPDSVVAPNSLRRALKKSIEKEAKTIIYNLFQELIENRERESQTEFGYSEERRLDNIERARAII